MNDSTARTDDIIAQTYETATLNGLTCGVVAAYLSNNHITPSEIPELIRIVREALAAPLEAKTEEPEQPKLTPQQIKKSITPEALISFEDGKPYKTLRRHLTIRGLTPEGYRAKWGLPIDYPMTSAAYSEQRSELAKSLGLGQQRRAAAKSTTTDETVTADAPSEKPKRRKIGIS